jgi:hypothetical protein
VHFSKSVISYKLRAASVSFAVFLLLGSVLAFITHHFWFPGYLFWLDGGMQGLRIVYAVDFVLGPLLVLVFFHPEKSRKKLIFDIAVIAAVQLSAMGWGAYQVYNQRPVVVVYGSDRFISVTQDLIGLQHKTPKDMATFSSTTPPYAYRRETRSEHERQLKIGLLFHNGIHFEAQVWLFQPYLPNLDFIFSRQKGIQGYINDVLPKAWAEWSATQEKKSMDDHRYALYEGRYRNALLIFSPQGSYEGYLSLSGTLLPYIADSAAPTTAGLAP